MCMKVGGDKNHQSYQIGQHILENVKEEKDLGVIINNQLNSHTKGDMVYRVGRKS